MWTLRLSAPRRENSGAVSRVIGEARREQPRTGLLEDTIALVIVGGPVGNGHRAAAISAASHSSYQRAGLSARHGHCTPASAITDPPTRTDPNPHA